KGSGDVLEAAERFRVAEQNLMIAAREPSRNFYHDGALDALAMKRPQKDLHGNFRTSVHFVVADPGRFNLGDAALGKQVDADVHGIELWQFARVEEKAIEL